MLWRTKPIFRVIHSLITILFSNLENCRNFVGRESSIGDAVVENSLRTIILFHFQVRLYACSGFDFVGVSSLEHGADTWFEMVLHRDVWQSREESGLKEDGERTAAEDKPECKKRKTEGARGGDE